MAIHQKTLSLQTRGKGTTEITGELERVLGQSGIRNGLLTVFCRHTSCSLVIMENADPSARRDLEDWLERLVPEGDRHFTHTMEGPDDMPSHIKMALTRTSETIPVVDGQLALGTWQGCFLWEHRARPHRRSLQVTLIGEEA
jgi:secondary thiamine-phosphate synthase enzyme